ncbi:hypothetical protein RFI_36385 [Reticulomyxa filosa]|uniref:Uncharacterized protein n=1 Tax=Reticulomyxa filosa TaxID=46433 RepID=X6LK05_RETFI|nr:hypothetical protein RFI_36385 [Reticulomyxa filosa]|eukprot:ETO01055.1 hypothetical protein RFI_36385 [Reticulomyxa filosa]
MCEKKLQIISIAQSYHYAYVCINNAILFFGGCGNGVIKSVYKYSIRENKWIAFENTLPCPLYDCAAILSEEDSNIHIIGGNIKFEKESIHMKTNVREWDPSYLVIIYLFIYLF